MTQVFDTKDFPSVSPIAAPQMTVVSKFRVFSARAIEIYRQCWSFLSQWTAKHIVMPLNARHHANPDARPKLGREIRPLTKPFGMEMSMKVWPLRTQPLPLLLPAAPRMPPIKSRELTIREWTIITNPVEDSAVASNNEPTDLNLPRQRLETKTAGPGDFWVRVDQLRGRENEIRARTTTRRVSEDHELTLQLQAVKLRPARSSLTKAS